jgi:hypothetical protein
MSTLVAGRLRCSNSDGDLEMLQWATTAADQPRLDLIVHHTDAQ